VRRVLLGLTLGVMLGVLAGSAIVWLVNEEDIARQRLPLPVGGHVLHFDEAATEAMRSAGMTWIKWNLPFIPGEDASAAQGQIEVAREARFKTLLKVRGQLNDLSDGGEAYLDAYAAYLGDLAAWGADAIEVWSDMNTDRSWTQGQIHPDHYAEMLRRAHAAIRAANPDTLIITGALLPTTAEKAFGQARVWNDDRYYRGMAKAGIADYADCIGLSYVHGMLPPSQQAGDLRGENDPTRYFTTLLDRAAFAFREEDIPICLTELGYLSPEGYGQLPLWYQWAAHTSVTEQAAWLSQAIEIAADYSRSPVDLLIVWSIDSEQYEPDAQAGYAIIRPDGSCPACQSIASLMR